MSNTSSSKTLEQRVAALEAILEIENLVAIEQAYHGAQDSVGAHDATFARREDTAFIPFGNTYTGFDKIRERLVGSAASQAGKTGMLYEHAMATPIIEVADDGMTAKGVWLSPGFVSQPGGQNSGGAVFSWHRYGFDFIKEKGVWKILRDHVYTDIDAGVGKTWANELRAGSPNAAALSTSGTLDAPNTPYSPKAPPPLAPRLPEPYSTYRETFKY